MTSDPQLPVAGPAASGPGERVRVGPYELLSLLGEGGMGVVHLARGADGRRVALKLLRPHIVGDQEARARLAREVASLDRIRSRWIAEILDADPWAEIPYVATRYVPGLSLHDHVREDGPIAGRDLLWFAGCLAEGVASVHRAGVLHRDVKPSNVIMEGRTPILIDFGLARVADDPRLTHTGWLLGTPGYLAPEILYGDDATAASDVHSWAATVAFAGTGAAPFGRGPAMAIMDRVRRGEHDLSGLPEQLREVVAAALDPEPGRRPDLERLLAWLRPLSTDPTAAQAPAPLPVDDLFTLPLALAADPSETFGRVSGDSPRTLVEPGEPAVRATPTRMLEADPTRGDVADGNAADENDDERWGGWPDQEPPAPVRAPFLERVRRCLLLAALAALVGAGSAVAPWVALTTVLLGVWLVRSGSIAGSAVQDRRLRRGRKFYDGPQVLLAAPWHLVQSIPGTLLLLLWSAGLALAAGLICYALAAGIPVTLFACGVTLAGSLWWGPGGSRVRSPVSRVVDPLARSTGVWLLVVLVLAGVGVAAALVVGSGSLGSLDDVVWFPAQSRPFG